MQISHDVLVPTGRLGVMLGGGLWRVGAAMDRHPYTERIGDGFL
jgi:hypothetical protein